MQFFHNIRASKLCSLSFLDNSLSMHWSTRRNQLTWDKLQDGLCILDGGGDLGEAQHNITQQPDHGVSHLQHTESEGAHTKRPSTSTHHTHLKAFDHLQCQCSVFSLVLWQLIYTHFSILWIQKGFFINIHHYLVMSTYPLHIYNLLCRLINKM